jgi:hypothetical protein
VQSLGRTYSRRHLESSQNLSRILINRMLSLRLSLRSGRPNTLFERQSIVRCRSQTESVTATVQSDIFDRQSKLRHRRHIDTQARRQQSRPSQEISIRPTERQRHGQSTSWSLCTDTELYTGPHTESYTESTDMEHTSAEL